MLTRTKERIYRYRLQEMQKAFNVKYEGLVQGGNGPDIIEQVTRAAVAFDLLATNASSPVSTD